MIRQIAIQSSHETGHISEEALTCLGRQCLFLTSLDISSTKSVSDITFGASSFMRLATSFPSLTNLRIKYESATMMCMYDLLTQSDSLRLGGTIVLWERKKWMDASRWLEMEKEVSSIGTSVIHWSFTGHVMSHLSLAKITSIDHFRHFSSRHVFLIVF